MKKGDKIIVKGFGKIGTVDNEIDDVIYVVFEKIKIEVDKKTNCIILPSNCVQIK